MIKTNPEKEKRKRRKKEEEEEEEERERERVEDQSSFVLTRIFEQCQPRFIFWVDGIT